ncbi:MAG: dihydrofolate reductase family protein [Gemmatimonadaceae bacterium]
MRSRNLLRRVDLVGRGRDRETETTARKDIALFGSADLASTLMRLGLIDEYRIMVNPVVQGGGSPMFKNTKGTTKLTLSKIRDAEFRNRGTLLPA